MWVPDMNAQATQSSMINNFFLIQVPTTRRDKSQKATQEREQIHKVVSILPRGGDLMKLVKKSTARAEQNGVVVRLLAHSK